VVTHSPDDLKERSARTLDGTLGFELTELDEERAGGRFEVTDAVRQPFGVVHGGAYAALAETLASAATFMAVQSEGNIAVGSSNHTSFLRPVTEGTVHAAASRRHRGRTTWVWEVDFTDDEGRLCALARVTMAVRPAPG
jgi:1,4-dihydroxy-2-naphthoyl-CoA hydrolase